MNKLLQLLVLLVLIIACQKRDSNDFNNTNFPKGECLIREGFDTYEFSKFYLSGPKYELEAAMDHRIIDSIYCKFFYRNPEEEAEDTLRYDSCISQAYCHSLYRKNLSDISNMKTGELLKMEIRQPKPNNYCFYKHIEFGNIEDTVWSEMDVLLIEYPLTSTLRKKNQIISALRFGDIDSISHESFTIEWASKSLINPKFAEYHSLYTWGINVSTDTIWTNLPKDFIFRMYPDFQGEYIFKKYDSIIVDYKYQVGSKEFFDNIRLVE